MTLAYLGLAQESREAMLDQIDFGQDGLLINNNAK